MTNILSNRSGCDDIISTIYCIIIDEKQKDLSTKRPFNRKALYHNALNDYQVKKINFAINNTVSAQTPLDTC